MTATLHRKFNSIPIIVLTLLMSGCAGVVGSQQRSLPGNSEAINISPPAPSVRVGSTQLFTATVTGISNPQLAWSVNNIPGGNAAVGTITESGTLSANYLAPASVPAGASVTIKAWDVSNNSVSSATTAMLLNPVPQLSAVSPSQLNVGAFTIAVYGSSFVNGAVVTLGGASLPTNFVSSTELTASGTALGSQVGTASVAVINPNPGSAASSSLYVSVVSGATLAPQIHASPPTINVPTGGMEDVSITATGNPTPTVACAVTGVGTAQLSGSAITYIAPNVLPEGGESSIVCTAENSAGSSSATITANISTVLPIGYAGAIPSTYFGMHIVEPQDWPTVTTGTLGKVTGVLWADLEQSKGVFDWSRLDQFVGLASTHGITLMYSSVGVPPWAAADQSTCHSQPYFATYCTGMVSNLQDWDDFVTALVTRYKGKIQIYELWNEPEHTFSGTMDQLVTLTQNEHDIIRSIDPAATILSPSMVSEGYAYLDSYFASGGTMDIDAVAFHAYPNPSNDIAETITQSMSVTIKTVMSKYGLSAKPLWNTEGSWGQQNAGAITDPDLRAAFIAREYVLNWSIGISRLYWYAWDNSNVGTLWGPTGVSPEPAIAYQQVLSWMDGATMPQGCSTNGAVSAYHAIYTCVLTRDGGYQATAVWNTDGASTFTAPGQYIHYRDLQGNVYEVPANHEVSIGLKPILLENK